MTTHPEGGVAHGSGGVEEVEAAGQNINKYPRKRHEVPTKSLLQAPRGACCKSAPHCLLTTKVDRSLFLIAARGTLLPRSSRAQMPYSISSSCPTGHRAQPSHDATFRSRRNIKTLMLLIAGKDA